MEYQVETVEDIAVVFLPLDVIDASNVEEFKKDIAVILEENTNMVLDMSQVRFVDSSGCGALISCLRKVKEKGGELKICCLSEVVGAQVGVLFRLVRLDRVLDMLNTREEAIQSFKA